MFGKRAYLSGQRNNVFSNALKCSANYLYYMHRRINILFVDFAHYSGKLR